MFFDEAHLLFSDTPKALLDRIEQVVRLIRSKGVGVYFVPTQSPLDCPTPCWRSWATGFSTRCVPFPA
ncbi:helicase HerA-like domain-containing protein [Halopseudomonas pachastrellae]|nr:helicase HerA-like domain-containing protein [Halopseudomonas pachastrellae]